MKNKRGISLIVLIITIILVLILAVAVVFAFIRNNPIISAKRSVRNWNKGLRNERFVLSDADWLLIRDDLKDENLIVTYENILDVLYDVDTKEVNLYQAIDGLKKTLELHGYNDLVNDYDSIYDKCVGYYNDSEQHFEYFLYILNQMQYAYGFSSAYITNGNYLIESGSNRRFLLLDGVSFNNNLLENDPELKQYLPNFSLPNATGTSDSSELVKEIYDFSTELRKEGAEVGICVSDGSSNYLVYSTQDSYLTEGKVCYRGHNMYNPDTQKFDRGCCIPIINSYLIGLDTNEIFYIDDNGYPNCDLPF